MMKIRTSYESESRRRSVKRGHSSASASTPRRDLVFGFKLDLQDVDYDTYTVSDILGFDDGEVENMLLDENWSDLFDGVEHVVDMMSDGKCVAVRPYPNQPRVVYILVKTDSDDEKSCLLEECLKGLAIELSKEFETTPTPKFMQLGGVPAEGYTVPLDVCH